MDRHYEFIRMPFGMIHSGAILPRTVKMLVRVMNNMVYYVDDLLVYTQAWEDRKRTKRAPQAATTDELYRETNKVHAWGKDDRLGESSIGLQDENVEKVWAAKLE
ncbi:Zinc finger protein [Plakobranchus ocellatus]|uniref:Zinc finger protein n=1 Tax=Plakobranchus ocellatus TaxID=259542 RepID=A0AAV4D562_9GAST|nr:Zinc finger protein [Plakobranchus ocellatus]